MALTIDMGFDGYAYTGGVSMDLDVEYYVLSTLTDTYNWTIQYTPGDMRSHTGFQDYLGPNKYPSLLDDLIAARGADPVDISYDNDLGQYSFSITGGGPGDQLRLIFSADGLKELLGFSASTPTEVNTETSDQAPRYWFGSDGYESSVTEDHEPDDIARIKETQGGNVYHISPGGSPVHHNFTLSYEKQEKVFNWKAKDVGGGSIVGTTLQGLYENARGVHPFMVQHDFGNALHHLRGAEAYFEPERNHPEHNDRWNVPFRTYVTRVL